MSSVVISCNVKVPQKDIVAVCFQTDESQNRSIAEINSVVEDGLDIRYLLLMGEDYDNLEKWWRVVGPSNPSRGHIAFALEKKPDMPQINALFDRRTNILENKTFELQNNRKYALVLDNSYSLGTSKSVKTTIKVLQTSVTVEKVALQSVTEFHSNLPDEVFTNLQDANDCYQSGHFRQCAVMMRRTIETAIKLKALQSGLSTKLLQHDNGDELSFSKKLAVLLKHDLISPRVAKDVEDVKWYGDVGAHGKMRITKSDVFEILEPKLRNFISNLSLKKNGE